MRKVVYTVLMVVAICLCCAATSQTPGNDCTRDIKDKRGKMKPWKKGARETGKYRNVSSMQGIKWLILMRNLPGHIMMFLKGQTGFISR